MAKRFEPACAMGFDPVSKRATRAQKVIEHKVVVPPRVTISDPITQKVRRAVLTEKSSDGTFRYAERNLTIGIKAKTPSTLDPEHIHRVLYGSPLPSKIVV